MPVNTQDKAWQYLASEKSKFIKVFLQAGVWAQIVSILIDFFPLFPFFLSCAPPLSPPLGETGGGA